MRLKDMEKQQRIKDAMVRLFLREGIDGASVSKIAREAGVSPATIYVYYSSKEEMLAEVFREYAHESYRFLLRQLRPEMDGGELIETLVRSCYAYSTERAEEFSFVEQCSRCPSLAAQVCETDCGCDIFALFHSLQERGAMRRVSDMNLGAVLFAPVRFLAMNRGTAEDSEALLSELVRMLQYLLLS